MYGFAERIIGGKRETREIPMFGLKISEVFVTQTLGRQFMRTKNTLSEIEKHGFSKIEK